MLPYKPSNLQLQPVTKLRFKQLNHYFGTNMKSLQFDHKVVEVEEVDSV